MVQFIEVFIILFVVLSLASLASLFSEKAGIVNISIEGNMIIGAITYLVLMSDSVGLYEAAGFIAPFIAAFIAIIFTCIFSLFFGFAIINLGADQVIIGTGMNLVAPAIAIIFSYIFFEKSVAEVPIYEFLLGEQKFNGYVIIFLTIAVIIIIVCWILFKYGRFGVRLTASGENPYALEVSGHSVFKYRYFALLITGALSGFAGVVFTLQISAFFGTVFGIGFLALGIVIFGQWKVLNITLGSLIISIIFAFSVNWTFFFPLSVIPEEFIKMIPFIIPLIILVFFKNARGPDSIGDPFRKDRR